MSREQWQRDKVEPKDFYKFLADLTRQLLKRQEQQWIGHYTTMLVSSLYYMGKQTLMRRGRFGVDIADVSSVHDPIYVSNKIRYYVDNVTAMGVMSSPEVLFQVMQDDDQKRKRALHAIRSVDQKFNYDHYTQHFRQSIWKHGQFCGSYHAEVWYDKDLTNGREWYEEFEPLIIPGAELMSCEDCGHQEPFSGQALACPHCSGVNVSIEKTPDIETQNLAQAGWKPVGDVRVDHIPAYLMRYSLTVGPERSPWRYVEQDIPTESVERIYGKLHDKAKQSELSDDEMLHPARIMRRAEAQRRNGSNSAEDHDSILMQRFWLEPEMLHFISCDKQTKLPSGEVIEPGVRLSEVFPDGMRILTCPGLPEFLDVARESHRERFVDGLYGINPGSHMGYGIEDAREYQRQYNVAHSMNFTYMRRNALPAIVALQQVFPDGNFHNRPDGTILVNKNNLPDGASLNDAFAFLKSPERSFVMDTIMNTLEGNMQQSIKSLVGSASGPSQFSETATGDRLEADKQNVLLSLQLGLYGDWVKEIAIKRIRLAQQHYGEMRLIGVFNERTAEWDARELQKADLDGEFFAWVKPGSAMPMLPEQKMTRMKLALEAAMAVMGSPMDTPSFRRQLGEYFQVDLGFERGSEYEDVCQEDLSAMQQAESQMGDVAGDPMMTDMLGQQLSMVVKVSPFEAGNEIKINWWREWLASPAGRRASDALRRAVEFTILRLKGSVDIERAAVAESALIGAGQLPPPLATTMMGAPGAEPGSGGSVVPQLPQDGNAFAQGTAVQRQDQGIAAGGPETKPSLPPLVQGVTK